MPKQSDGRAVAVVHKRTDPEAASGDIHNPRGGLRESFPPCVGKSRRVGGVACGQPFVEAPDLLGVLRHQQGKPMRSRGNFGPRPNWRLVSANHAETCGEVQAQRRTSRGIRPIGRMASDRGHPFVADNDRMGDSATNRLKIQSAGKRASTAADPVSQEAHKSPQPSGQWFSSKPCWQRPAALL